MHTSIHSVYIDDYTCHTWEPYWKCKILYSKFYFISISKGADFAVPNCLEWHTCSGVIGVSGSPLLDELAFWAQPSNVLIFDYSMESLKLNLFSKFYLWIQRELFEGDLELNILNTSFGRSVFTVMLIEKLEDGGLQGLE